MKKLFISAAILFSLSASAQKVTDTLLIKIDTATYKRVVALVRENIDTRTESGKLLIGNILFPLQNFTFLQPADKPKEIIKK